MEEGANNSNRYWTRIPNGILGMIVETGKANFE